MFQGEGETGATEADEAEETPGGEREGPDQPLLRLDAGLGRRAGPALRSSQVRATVRHYWDSLSIS